MVFLWIMDNNLDTKLSIYNHHIPTFSSVFRGFSHGFPLLFPIPKGSCPAKKNQAFHHDLRAHHVQRRGHRVAAERRQGPSESRGEGSCDFGIPVKRQGIGDLMVIYLVTLFDGKSLGDWLGDLVIWF